MARARNGNQRGTPTGPFGRRRDRVLKTAGRPTPRTGGGMKLPTKRVRPPKPTDTGGRVMPKKYKPRLQVDPQRPKKYKPRLQVDPRKPKKPVQRPRRAAMGNGSRRGFRR